LLEIGDEPPPLRDRDVEGNQLDAGAESLLLLLREGSDRHARGEHGSDG
jgi:hypothetical protein